MSARQLNRLAKAKGLDHLLGGALNEESDASEGTEDSEEDEPFSRGGVISASAFGDDSDESSSSSEEEEDSSSQSDGGSEKAEPTEASAVATAAASSSSSSSSASHEVAPTTASPVSSPNDDAPGTSPPPSSATPSKPQKSADPVKGPTAAASAAVASSKGRTAERENDDQYLDNVISELASAAAAAAAAAGETSLDAEGGVSSPLARLLQCDPRCLKLDLELRRKFGAGVGGGGGGGDRENGAAAGRGGRARRPRRGMMMARGGNAPASLALKRLVVSAPKEDWPKPPSLVGGGLGMKRCEAPAYLPPWQLRAHSGADWFVFERSSSLEQLQRRFEAIQGMHDPNLLGAFASQAPYHADALLQLAMVFAHTGQMDRASEFVGRCLYVLESSSMEAFRPLEGACRLDATLDVNKTYLAAMFRHMQMAGMVGGARTALEVGRLLLSVDPLGDPMGCLLALDSHALACREGKFILELYESKLPIGHSPSELSRNLSGVATTPAAAAAAATWVISGVRPESASEYKTAGGPGVTVQDLPGLSMSVCLAKLDSGAGVAAAREAMAATLLRFPVMLEPLLEKCGVSPRSTTYPQDWRSVMQHPHFAVARGRIPTGHVLLHLASIFAERGGEIWKHDRAMELLYDGAGIALQGLGTASMLDAKAANGEAGAPGATAAASAGATAAATTAAGAAAATTAAAAAGAAVAVAEPSPSSVWTSASEEEVLRRAYGVGSPLHKYLNLEVSDFAEAFALLPQDANILNPRLMGPNFMNERVRLRMPAGARGGGGGILDGDLGAMRDFGGHGGGVDWRGQRREAGRRSEGNLTPAAPLAQLFWQTLMPWNTFPTPSHPSPPPPRWL